MLLVKPSGQSKCPERPSGVVGGSETEGGVEKGRRGCQKGGIGGHSKRTHACWEDSRQDTWKEDTHTRGGHSYHAQHKQRVLYRYQG